MEWLAVVAEVTLPTQASPTPAYRLKVSLAAREAVSNAVLRRVTRLLEPLLGAVKHKDIVLPPAAGQTGPHVALMRPFDAA